MIADMINNKRYNQVVNEEIFIKERKLNVFLVFITQWYFTLLKDVRLNSTHIHFCFVLFLLFFWKIQTNKGV